MFKRLGCCPQQVLPVLPVPPHGFIAVQAINRQDYQDPEIRHEQRPIEGRKLINPRKRVIEQSVRNACAERRLSIKKREQGAQEHHCRFWCLIYDLDRRVFYSLPVRELKMNPHESKRITSP